MQLVPSVAIVLYFLVMPIYSHRKAHLARSSETTFLSPDDFDRAQNMSFSEAESTRIPVSLNDPEMHYTYYEGDMMIQESDENKVAMYTAKRWPNGRIPYIMENNFSPDERAAIARAIMVLQERTCIRFVPKRSHDSDYVLMKRGPGCAAHVGKIGGQQWVILGDGCYGIETVTHELMHSVGFIHEQSRPDRDQHVEIVWENIKPAAKRNFKKHEHDYLADHGFPYDLMSVMHYRQYAFSKNRKPTILPKRPVPYLRCKGLDCPSELDIKKINFLYKCQKNEYDEDGYDNYIEKDMENEVTVDEILIGKNSLDDQFNPTEEVDHRPCLDEECYRQRYQASKPVRYNHPYVSPFAYDNVNYRGDLMHRLFFGPRAKRNRFLARHPLMPSPLVSPMVRLF